MAVLGLTVMRNEADRYLLSMLRAVFEVVDDHFVFDDCSDDDSVEVARSTGALVQRRQPDEPSFLEHEGRFRQAAWDAFQKVMRPQWGDWILAIDADEFLVSKASCVRCEVNQAIRSADQAGASSVVLPIPEVFGWDDDGTPLIRTDGYWGTIRGTRLFRYEPDGVFKNKSMGSGSEPTYVEASRFSPNAYGLHLLHLGYADEADQMVKHQRYTRLLEHGHNNQHVQSIVGQKQLVRWDGPIPKVRRG